MEKKHSAAIKEKVDMAALANDRILVEFTQQFKINPDNSIKKLYAKIGQFTLENDFGESVPIKRGLLGVGKRDTRF